MSKSRRPRAPPLAAAAGAIRCRGAVPTPALRHAATATAATLGAATAATTATAVTVTAAAHGAVTAAAHGAAAARAAPAAARELVGRDRRGGTAGLGG